jgi:hypothetical protein
MKKQAVLLFSALLVVFGFKLNAQQVTDVQIVKIIHTRLPNINLQNKIIALHVLSSANKESRETNKEFDKVYKAYEFAKLKNGTQGVVFISVNIDDNTVGSITAGKDGISKAVIVNKSEYAFLSNLTSGYNVVYDNTGGKVYENIESNKVFSSFNSLITR